MILEPGTRRHRRRDDAVLARLGLLRDSSPEQIAARLATSGGRKGTTIAELSRLTALAPWRITALLQGLPVEVSREGLVLAAEEASRRKRERLAPKSDAGHAKADAQRLVALEQSMRAAGLAPPTPRELAADPSGFRAVERLLRDGVLVRTRDRAKDREMIFHRDAIATAREVLAPLLGEGGGLLVTEIASALGISRKFCMPLLDHLDGIRFTRREGDRRVLFKAG